MVFVYIKMFCYCFNILFKKYKLFKKIILNVFVNFLKYLFFFSYKEIIEVFVNFKKEFNGI